MRAALIVFRLGFLFAVYAALKVYVYDPIPRSYGHDPYCEIPEPIYEQRPCRPWRTEPPPKLVAEARREAAVRRMSDEELMSRLGLPWPPTAAR